MRAIPVHETTAMGDFRRYPACRLLLTCAYCAWSKSYDPERVIRRLQELKAGGHATQISQVARRVAWPCPGCGRMGWRAQFAWPVDLDPLEVKRLTNLYRN
jgi:hypothetical protein